MSETTFDDYWEPETGLAGDAVRPLVAGVEPDPLRPLLVSVDDAVEYLGVSRPTVHRLLTRGDIESRYFGRRRLVVYASLEAWADALPKNLR